MIESQYIRISATALAVLDVVLYVREPDYIITRVNVPSQYRWQGHGHRLLQRICRMADNRGVTLWIAPAPYGPNTMTLAVIRQWYKRHGFENDSTGLMFREPRARSAPSLVLPSLVTEAPIAQ
jgi:GNAT superfamily N-acetyltransferase